MRTEVVSLRQAAAASFVKELRARMIVAMDLALALACSAIESGGYIGEEGDRQVLNVQGCPGRLGLCSAQP